jgi:hypothetical protein
MTFCKTGISRGAKTRVRKTERSSQTRNTKIPTRNGQARRTVPGRPASLPTASRRADGTAGFRGSGGMFSHRGGSATLGPAAEEGVASRGRVYRLVSVPRSRVHPRQGLKPHLRAGVAYGVLSDLARLDGRLPRGPHSSRLSGARPHPGSDRRGRRGIPREALLGGRGRLVEKKAPGMTGAELHAPATAAFSASPCSLVLVSPVPCSRAGKVHQQAAQRTPAQNLL